MSAIKKKYILIPAACVVLLIAIVICVALALNTGYLEKLPYDHMSDTVYNGVEIVGDDGLFYLVKNGKRVSEGYASLKSVNDFYGDIESLVSENKSVTLFDYYIARTVENSDYLIVNSEGEEVMISGDSYTLDTENTRLPYLVFTNNTNGLKAAISVYRLDSDISYKAGNELTLRPFKSVKAVSTCENSAVCAYLETDDITDGAQKSYFRADGIKLTTGADVSVISLYEKNNTHTRYTYFYNSSEGTLFSASGERIATGITERFRTSEENWQYVLCQNAETAQISVVVFSFNTFFTLSDNEYDLSTLDCFGDCLTVVRRNNAKTDVIGASGTVLGSYISVAQNGSILTATVSDGSYAYLSKSGSTVMTGVYGDMTPVEELNDESCTVLMSAQYNEKNSSTYYHFARAGSSLYTLDVSELESITKLTDECASFLVAKNTEGKTLYSVLSPFSAIKLGEEYDTLSLYSHGGVDWVLAESYERKTADIVDPLTARAVTTISCEPDDFARYKFIHDGNVALATDPLNADTAVHISIIRLEKYETDDMLDSAKYFAVYRPAAYADTEALNSTPLLAPELGVDLRLDSPYDVYTTDNYLIVHTATGSGVFSLDEGNVLTDTAVIPYHVSRVITDMKDTVLDYFVVTTDSGMQGLYNTYSEVVLSPYYSDIVAVEDGYIIVSMRGAYGVIRAKSNGNTEKVIDFLYSRITPIGDKGYYAVTGEGKIDIYDRSKKILSKSIQSIDTVRAYTETEEEGISLSYWYMFSADARLYLHRSEQTVLLTFGDYEHLAPVSPTPLNARARVIYYYYDSRLVHTQVIYPTDETIDTVSSLYLHVDGQQWYTSENGTETVTNAYFDGRHIIKLYGHS